MVLFIYEFGILGIGFYLLDELFFVLEFVFFGVVDIVVFYVFCNFCYFYFGEKLL